MALIEFKWNAHVQHRFKKHLHYHFRMLACYSFDLVWNTGYVWSFDFLSFGRLVPMILSLCYWFFFLRHELNQLKGFKNNGTPPVADEGTPKDPTGEDTSKSLPDSLNNWWVVKLLKTLNDHIKSSFWNFLDIASLFFMLLGYVNRILEFARCVTPVPFYLAAVFFYISFAGLLEIAVLSSFPLSGRVTLFLTALLSRSSTTGVGVMALGLPLLFIDNLKYLQGFQVTGELVSML